MPTISLLIALSITAPAIAVNAANSNLSSFNRYEALRDSVKDKPPFEQVLDTLFSAGNEGEFDSTIAPIIGLPSAMPARGFTEPIGKGGDDKRSAFVVYESEAGTENSAGKKPICLYMIRRTRSGQDQTSHYYRVNLKGELERAVQTQGKRDADGKPIRGSGVKFDQDIASSEVKKAFEAELKYWTKDWLKARKKEEEKARKAASSKK